ATTACKQLEELSGKIFSHREGKQFILVFNKTDLLHEPQKGELISALPHYTNENTSHIFISAKQHTGTDDLQQMLINLTHLPIVTQNDVIVTNVRHYEALTHAFESIRRVLEGLQTNISGDLLSQDIQECIFYLGEIVGKITNEMVLENIFGKFCIGK
ncbi:tRNA modification GTPase MnmE, partial [termite gut metagenome]